MIGRVARAVCAARGRGRFPIVPGGDRPVMLGALAALQDEQDRPGLRFVDGHEDAWPPLDSPTGEAADCELGLALGLFDAVLDPRLRGVFPRIRGADVIAIGPRDHDEIAAAGVPTLAGQLRALIRPAGFDAVKGAAAIAVLPAPWWLHTDLDVLASTELAAVDYPQPGGLTWETEITSAALASEGCAGWSVCIYNPTLIRAARVLTTSSATSPKRSPMRTADSPERSESSPSEHPICRCGSGVGLAVGAVRDPVAGRPGRVPFAGKLVLHRRACSWGRGALGEHWADPKVTEERPGSAAAIIQRRGPPRRGHRRCDRADHGVRDEEAT